MKVHGETIKSIKVCPLGAELFRADGKMDRHYKEIDAILNFSNSSKYLHKNGGNKRK